MKESHAFHIPRRTHYGDCCGLDCPIRSYEHQQPAAEPAKAEPNRAKIVPVVQLKPGETKDLLLSTDCTVGVTRSGGLDIREIGSKGREAFQSSKVWKKDGVVVEVPDFGEASKGASLPLFAPLKKRGLDAFLVKVTAAPDAKPALYDLHIADFTCNGTCDTDFRVLVSPN